MSIKLGIGMMDCPIHHRMTQNIQKLDASRITNICTALHRLTRQQYRPYLSTGDKNYEKSDQHQKQKTMAWP